MALKNRFDDAILELIESSIRHVKAQPINLGGISGPGGGAGGPPGGFLGRLPQSRVSYDETEAETDFTPVSGMSLVDNLNRIRHRISALENTVTSGAITLSEYDGIPTIPGITHIVFSGAAITDNGGGMATVSLSGGLGGASSLDDLTDVQVINPSQGDILVRKEAQWENISIPTSGIVGRKSGSDVGPLTPSDALNIIFQGDVTHTPNSSVNVFNNLLTVDNSETRVEIGADHFLPTRDAPNRNIYFNEARQDMDFIVRGVSQDNLIRTDASANRVGIGKVPSFPFDVNGDVNALTFRVNGVGLSSTHVLVADNNNKFSGSTVEDALYELAIKQRLILLMTHGVGTNVPASSTYYMIPNVPQTQAPPYSMPMPVSGTLKSLFVRQASTQPASGSLQFMIYAGDVSSMVNTGIGVTFDAGSAPQNRSDTSNTYTIYAGQHIQFRLINNATSASANIGGVTLLLELN